MRTQNSLAKAIDLLNQAIQIDPQFQALVHKVAFSRD
jgi:hypothetical protein